MEPIDRKVVARTLRAHHWHATRHTCACGRSDGSSYYDHVAEEVARAVEENIR